MIHARDSIRVDAGEANMTLPVIRNARVPISVAAPSDAPASLEFAGGFGYRRVAMD